MDNDVRSLREARGLTQAQLGAALGVSRQSVNSIEKASTTPPFLWPSPSPATLRPLLRRSFMSESDPTPTPSSAAAAASSSPGSTSSARASQKATNRRRSAIGGMACVVAVVTLLWAAVLTIPMSNGVLYFFYGGASGASVVMLVYIALIIAKRRGHDTFAVRGLERRKDERDRPPRSGPGLWPASSGCSATLSSAPWVPSGGR